MPFPAGGILDVLRVFGGPEGRRLAVRVALGAAALAGVVVATDRAFGRSAAALVVILAIAVGGVALACALPGPARRNRRP